MLLGSVLGFSQEEADQPQPVLEPAADKPAAEKTAGEEKTGGEPAAALELPIELKVEDCIQLAILFNRNIQEKYLEFRKTDNDILIDRSDLLPKIDLQYEYADDQLDSSSSYTTDDSSSLLYTQRILEFGKDASDNVSTREDIRNAIYSLQNAVKNTVSDVRRDFYYILLKQKQMLERQRLLDEFRENLLIAKAKYAKGQILEVDVFTSELNVLNEELRINEIKRAILKRKMDLRYSMGCSIPLDFILSGRPEALELGEDEAVDSALKQSYLIDLLKGEIAEKEREIAEKKWEYMPQVTFQIGYDSYRNSIAVDLSQSGYVWGVDLTAESFIDPPSSRETAYPTEEMRDASFSFQIKLPLFDGFKRREETEKERKELRILRTGMRDTLEGLRRDVLKDYQDYYEQKERLEIIRRRVEISKRRLQINEKLKEFGKVDDNQLETFRNAFFSQQDQLYAGQDSLIQAEEDIRAYLFDGNEYIRLLEHPEKMRARLQKKYPALLKGEDTDEH